MDDRRRSGGEAGAQPGLFDLRPQEPAGSGTPAPEPGRTTPTKAEPTAANTAPHTVRPRKRRAAVSTDDKTEEPHYHGHRQRLRARFMAAPDALADYELVEMMLFSALPRQDTKPVAKALMARFGSFAEMIQAPEEQLREVDYVKDAAVTQIKLVRAAALRLMRTEIMGRRVLGSWTAVLDYCRAAQGFEAKEQFRILFLDKRNQLIADEVQQTGTVDHTPVYVREVVKRALELAATALILVHNHPSGDTTPSRADIDMTRQIVDAARPLGITIHDHVIVGRSGHTSLKSLKLM